MSLRDFLLGLGVSWSWTLPTGAEKDECAQPGCGVQRIKHDGLGHRFVEGA